MKVDYTSNNSGGKWWLSTKEWDALRAAGWKLGEPIRLGGVVGDASLECETPLDAVKSWESATGLDSTDEGCGCCGPPHCFSWPCGYAAGVDILQVLYDARFRHDRSAQTA